MEPRPDPNANQAFELEKKKGLDLVALHQELVHLPKNARVLIFELFDHYSGEADDLIADVDASNAVDIDKVRKILEKYKGTIQTIKDHLGVREEDVEVQEFAAALGYEHSRQNNSDNHDPIAEAKIELERKKDLTAWQVFKRRMGRAANVATDLIVMRPKITANGRQERGTYQHNDFNVINGHHPREIRALGVLAYNAVFGLVDLAWNSTLGRAKKLKINTEVGKVKAESETLKERTERIHADIAEKREHVHTNLNGIGGNVLGFMDWLDEGHRLDDIDQIREQREKEEEARRKKHPLLHRRKRTGWHNEAHRDRWWEIRHRPGDSYYGDKIFDDTIGKKAEYDDYQDSHLKAHQILNSLLKDSKHNPALLALLSTARNLDYSDGQTDFRDINAGELKNLAHQMRKSIDLTSLTKTYSGYIDDLERAKQSKSGKIWDRFMAMNDPDDPDKFNKVVQDIVQMQEDLSDAIAKMKKEAEETAAEWKKRTDEISEMFSEGELTFPPDANRRRSYFTFTTVKRSELRGDSRRQFNQHAAHEWGMSPDGEFTPLSLATGALARNINDVDFIEVRVHIYNEEGTAVDGESSHGDHGKGRVVGYIDSRTGSLLGANGDVAEAVEPPGEVSIELREFENAVATDDEVNLEVDPAAVTAPDIQLEIAPESHKPGDSL